MVRLHRIDKSWQVNCDVDGGRAERLERLSRADIMNMTMTRAPNSIFHWRLVTQICGD